MGSGCSSEKIAAHADHERSLAECAPSEQTVEGRACRHCCAALVVVRGSVKIPPRIGGVVDIGIQIVHITTLYQEKWPLFSLLYRYCTAGIRGSVVQRSYQ